MIRKINIEHIGLRAVTLYLLLTGAGVAIYFATVTLAAKFHLRGEAWDVMTGTNGLAAVVIFFICLWRHAAFFPIPQRVLVKTVMKFVAVATVTVLLILGAISVAPGWENEVTLVIFPGFLTACWALAARQCNSKVCRLEPGPAS